MLDCYELLILRTLFLLLMLVYSRFGNCGIFCYSCCWGMPPLHCFGEHRSQKLETSWAGQYQRSFNYSIFQYFQSTWQQWGVIDSVANSPNRILHWYLFSKVNSEGSLVTIWSTATVLEVFWNTLHINTLHFHRFLKTHTIQPSYLLAYMQPYLS